LELISIRSKLSENHPDYKRLEKEIEELEKHTLLFDNNNKSIKRLEDLKARLAEKGETMGEKHPDVISLKKEIALLTESIEKESMTMAFDDPMAGAPDNPAYISIQTQIESAELDILGLKGEKKLIEEKIAEYEQRLANTPAVEREYNKLLLDYEMARTKYSEINSKLMEARVAQGMEETQRGERFTIIDPAQLPEKPSKPNRVAILLIGIVLALGAGVGTAAVREVIDNSIKTPEELISLTGAPVLSVISLIETSYERRARWIRRFVFLIAAVLILGIGILAFHRFVMPLEVFSAKLERKINKMQPI
jgi:uncharacterized protein involved in exopolysaccharide biosynthesis